MRRALVLVAFVAFVAFVACAPRDTGGELVTFHAYASGLTDGALAFDTGAGYHVTLTTARMHIGAVYMRLGEQHLANAACIGDTTYGLQVPGAVDVDLLSVVPQEFSVLGHATTDVDLGAEVWLTGGDINDVAAGTGPLVTLDGTATRGSATYPFSASLTIGKNRLVPASNPAQPGQNPICKQRIVALIPVAIRPTVGGNLVLRVDPRSWLGSVEFSTLGRGDGTPVQIPDSNDGEAGRALFQAVTGASADVYQFSFLTP